MTDDKEGIFTGTIVNVGPALILRMACGVTVRVPAFADHDVMRMAGSLLYQPAKVVVRSCMAVHVEPAEDPFTALLVVR